MRQPFPVLFLLGSGCFGSKTPAPTPAPTLVTQSLATVLPKTDEAPRTIDEFPTIASSPPLSDIPTRVFESYGKGVPVTLEAVAGAELRVTLENGTLDADPFLGAQDFEDVRLLGVRNIGATALEVRFSNLGQTHTAIWTFDSFYGGLRNIYRGQERSRGVRERLADSDPAFSWRPEGLCRVDEEPLVQCSLASNRHVSLCRDGQGLRYRMGSRSKVEVSLPGADTPRIDITAYEALPETHWTLVHAENDDQLYTLSLAESEGELNGWVSVTEGGRPREQVACTSASKVDNVQASAPRPHIPAAISGLWGSAKPDFLLTVSLDDLTLWDVDRSKRLLNLERQGEHWRGRGEDCTLDLQRRDDALEVVAKGAACPVQSGTYRHRR